MDKNCLSSNQFKIYELSEGLYKNEKFFFKYIKNIEYLGFLVEKNLIDEIKKKINYVNLKCLFGKEETLDKFKKEIKDINIKEIILEKQNNSEELIKDLNNNKSFYLIKQDYLYNKIIDRNKAKGKEIKFKFTKEKIILIFNGDDELEFSNNKDGIIGFNFLIPKNISNNSHIFVEKNRESKIIPKDNIKFKTDLDILIRIFYFNKYLRGKENSSFKILNKEEKETVYLIHNSWMEEYKSHFDYQFLEKCLSLFSNDDRNIQDLSKESINKIIDRLPLEYIHRINAKEKFDGKKSFKYEYNQTKEGKNYLCNNNMINSKIYELLFSMDYSLNDFIRKLELYFIGNNKVLLLSNLIDWNKENDEIAFINDKGIFIPEYIIYIKENNSISFDILNEFLRKDFYNFYLNKNSDICQIKNLQKNTIGYCIKLNNKLEEDKILNKNNDDIIIKKKSVEEINPIIELMINIYLFKDELKNKIKRNLINTFEEKNYIISKEWMDNFKEIFDYEYFLHELNSKGIIKKYKQNNNNDKFLSEIISCIPEKFINDINTTIKENKIKFLKILQNYQIKLKQKNHIQYYTNFEIINDKTANIINKLFNIAHIENRFFY